ncbi:hypothetical protein SUGI_0252310 [Cryptomeria japonica]|nr:hypothetical protein SUGI_0252310 [Cryptomeria japonica]
MACVSHCIFSSFIVSDEIDKAVNDKESELCIKHIIGMVVLLRTGTLKEQGWHSAPERLVTLPNEETQSSFLLHL